MQDHQWFPFSIYLIVNFYTSIIEIISCFGVIAIVNRRLTMDICRNREKEYGKEYGIVSFLHADSFYKSIFFIETINRHGYKWQYLWINRRLEVMKIIQ